MPERVAQGRRLDEVCAFLGSRRTDGEANVSKCRGLHGAKGYARSLGERKTLCLEEAYILYLTLLGYRPRTLVEIGTQHGKSTRRLLDIKAALGLDCPVVCFDVADQVEHFTPQEAKLILQDLTGRF